MTICILYTYQGHWCLRTICSEALSIAYLINAVFAKVCDDTAPSCGNHRHYYCAQTPHCSSTGLWLYGSSHAPWHAGSWNALKPFVPLNKGWHKANSLENLATFGRTRVGGGRWFSMVDKTWLLGTWVMCCETSEQSPSPKMFCTKAHEQLRREHAIADKPLAGG